MIGRQGTDVDQEVVYNRSFHCDHFHRESQSRPPCAPSQRTVVVFWRIPIINRRCLPPVDVTDSPFLFLNQGFHLSLIHMPVYSW